MPIEIALPEDGTRPRADTFEIAIGDAVVRCEIGADVAYVAALVRALRGS
jgi:hypothetical protein